MEAVAFRVATLGDAEPIDALMKASTREFFPLFYDAEQTASSMRYVAVVDWMLIEDGTYYVGEAAREIVACGGWSRRDKLMRLGTGERTDRGRSTSS
jgi:hypothetical protein